MSRRKPSEAANIRLLPAPGSDPALDLPATLDAERDEAIISRLAAQARPGETATDVCRRLLITERERLYKRVDLNPFRNPGRPRQVESPEAFSLRARRYFDVCDALDDSVLLNGLMLVVGLYTRDGLNDYERRPEYTDAVKAAKRYVASAYERKLDRDRCAGPIFALKQFGWSDRIDIEHSGRINVDWGQLPAEVIARVSAGEDLRAVLASYQDGPLALIPATSSTSEPLERRAIRPVEPDSIETAPDDGSADLPPADGPASEPPSA